MQTKPATPITSFIYDTISSISTTHIQEYNCFLVFLAKMFRSCWNDTDSDFQTHTIYILSILQVWYIFPLSDTQNIEHKHIVGMIQLSACTKSGKSTVKYMLSMIFRSDFGAVKYDLTHHFFGNACTKLGPLRFSHFSGC